MTPALRAALRARRYVRERQRARRASYTETARESLERMRALVRLGGDS